MVTRRKLLLQMGLLASTSTVGFSKFQRQALALTLIPDHSRNDKLQLEYNAFDFMNNEQILDVQTGILSLDVWQELQNYIDYCLYTKKGAPILLPAGKYSISKPLNLGYGVNYNGSPYVSVNVQGAGTDSTIIVPTFSNAPAIVIQGANRSRLSNFKVLGKNLNYIYSTVLNNLSQPRSTIDQRIVTNWIDPSLASNANSRYAPYCGIAIDPYSNAAPATAYPAVSYPSFLGTVPQYNKTQGTFTTLDGINIQGFVIAVGVAVNGDTGQSDFVTIQHCWIQGNVYAVSLGGPNNRLTHFKESYVNDGFACFTNTIYGSQNGRIEGVNTNSGFDRLMYWLAPGTKSDLGGSISFTGCHGENIWCLGDYAGGAPRDCSITFDSCGIFMGWQSYTHIGKPPYELSIGLSSLAFRNNEIAEYTTLFAVQGHGSLVTIDGGYFLPKSSPTALYQKLAQSASVGFHVFNSSVAQRPTNFKIKGITQYNLDGTTTSPQDISRSSAPTSRQNPLCIHLLDQPCGGVLQPIPNARFSVSKSSLASIVLSGTTLTFTYTGRTDADFNMYGPAPGDIIYDGLSGSIFYVRARTGTAVTAELQNNYALVGSTPTLINAFSSSSGFFFIVCTRVYTPNNYLQGTIAYNNTTNAITSCGLSSGYAGFISEILAGDMMRVDPDTDAIISNRGNNCVVSSVNISTATITLGGANFPTNAIGNVRRQISFWVVPPLVNT